MDQADKARTDLTLHEVAGRLGEGMMSPDDMTTEQRREYVDQMVDHGYSTREIASVLRVHPRTIERDRQQLRESRAVRSSPTLAGEIAGELADYVRSSAERLTRMCNDPSIAPFARLTAEGVLVRNLATYARTMHQLGFFPKQTRYGQPLPEDLEAAMEAERQQREVGRRQLDCLNRWASRG